jgi:hypothetical protein
MCTHLAVSNLTAAQHWILWIFLDCFTGKQDYNFVYIVDNIVYIACILIKQADIALLYQCAYQADTALAMLNVRNIVNLT